MGEAGKKEDEITRALTRRASELRDAMRRSEENTKRMVASLCTIENRAAAALDVMRPIEVRPSRPSNPRESYPRERASGCLILIGGAGEGEGDPEDAREHRRGDHGHRRNARPGRHRPAGACMLFLDDTLRWFILK